MTRPTSSSSCLQPGRRAVAAVAATITLWLTASALVVVPAVVAAAAAAATKKCPCDEQRHCETISGPPVNSRQHGGEVYGFYAWWTGNAVKMNWTHVTTVAWANVDEIMCRAHQHGARAVMGAPAIKNLTELADHDARREWIAAALDQVQSSFRDGIVFDYEDPQPRGSEEGQTYARLVAETRDAFRLANPSLQISTCVPWSPNDIDGRAFPYKDLADASDLVYVMDYDTRSQVFDACIAGANAPLPGMIQGMEQWLSFVDPKKLVLGVPWYGYQYTCLEGTAPDALYCPIKQVPFRGVNCSDAAGKQVDYSKALKILQASNTSITGGLRRDANTGTLFFNDVQDGVVYQHWMEDPVLLRRKFAWARDHNLGGVGPYNFHALDPVNEPEESIAMWSAFDEFRNQRDVATTSSVA